MLSDQVGSKLRVCGAELQSERPGEPLDPATRAGSALRLYYNGCSPAAWDARLGAQVSPAPVALRLLGQVSGSVDGWVLGGWGDWGVVMALGRGRPEYRQSGSKPTLLSRKWK